MEKKWVKGISNRQRNKNIYISANKNSMVLCLPMLSFRSKTMMPTLLIYSDLFPWIENLSLGKANAYPKKVHILQIK